MSLPAKTAVSLFKEHGRVDTVCEKLNCTEEEVALVLKEELETTATNLFYKWYSRKEIASILGISLQLAYKLGKMDSEAHSQALQDFDSLPYLSRMMYTTEKKIREGMGKMNFSTYLQAQGQQMELLARIEHEKVKRCEDSHGPNVELTDEDLMNPDQNVIDLLEIKQRQVFA